MTGGRSVAVSFGPAPYSLDAISDLIRELGPVHGDDLAPLATKLALPREAFQLKAVADVLDIEDEPRELPELYSAVRRLVAVEAPITVVFGNVQSAGPAFFNLVSYLESVVDDVVIETRRGTKAPEMPPDADTLWSRGMRALRRSDMPAAHAYLSRAAALYGPGMQRLRCLAAACDALIALDRPDDALRVAQNGRAAAAAGGDDGFVARFSLFTTLLGDEDIDLERALDDITGALEAAHDDAGLAQALEATAHLRSDAGDAQGALDLMDGALARARAAGDRQTMTRVVAWICDALATGADATAQTKIEGLSWVAQVSPLVEVKRLATLARLRMKDGEVDEARRLISAAAELQTDLGQPGWVSGVPLIAGEIELAAGDTATAERILAAALTESEQVGHPDANITRVLLARARAQRREHL